MSGLRAAFEAVCVDAVKREGVFLSIYCRSPFYGGPEEGGWWGSDTVLEEYQAFDFIDDARAALNQIGLHVEAENNSAKLEYSKRCRRECEWIEARGLDDNALPEVNGPDSYFVRLETVRGSFESTGARHYE
jgi:hypothetical protein